MRIVSLELRRYGMFADTTVDFGPGCTLVYGPNEAGKSTLLHGLGDFIWGIESRKHPHQHTHTVRPKDMQLTSHIETTAEPITLTRHLKRLIDTDGQDVECPWEVAGDVSRDVWDIAFGLDLDGLQWGGRQVMDGEGDLADLIFLAETGQIVEKVHARIGGRLDEIYKQHRGAKSVEVRLVLKQIADVTEKIREQLVNAPAVDRAREELETARRRSIDLRTEQDRLDLSLDRAKELERCFGTTADLVGAEGELQQARAEGRSLPQDEFQRLDEALKNVDRVEREMRERTIDRDAEHRALQALRLRPEVERSSEAIRRVQEGVGTARASRQRALSNDLQRDGERKVRELLETLGQPVADDVNAAVADVRVSVEQRSQLDATAQMAMKARERVDDDVLELEQVRAKFDALQRSDFQQQDKGALQAARDNRDEAWSRIRDPWLSGELPSDSVRVEAATDLSSTITAADQVAESLSDELSQAAEIRGKVEQSRQQVRSISERLTLDTNKLAQVLEDWNGFALECGLTPGLDPEHWGKRAKALDQLVAAWQNLREVMEQRRDAKTEFQKFVSQVDELRPLLPNQPDDSFECANLLEEERQDADNAASAATVHRGNMSKFENQIQSLEDERTSALDDISTLIADGDENAGALRNHSRTVLDLENQTQDLINQLNSQRDPGSDLDKLREELAGRTPQDVRSNVSDAETARKEARQSLNSADASVSENNAEVQRLERGKSTAALNSELMEHGTRLSNLLQEFRFLSAQAMLLDAYRRDLTDRHDSPMLNSAGKYLSKLTDGRFKGFSTVVSGESRDLRVLRESDDSPTGTEEMEVLHLSEGTADQVFLALRLAGIQERQHKLSAVGAETLPVVLDDILMAFDDSRASAALRLLADLGEEFQIILLTHHRHVVELAGEIGRITVAELR